MTQFNADISAVTALGQQLDDVSSSARNVLDGAAGSVFNSHGAIGFPMQSPFDGTQASRSAAVGATQAASAELGGLLRQAAQAYERGDTAAAERLKAQAAELEGRQGGSPTGTGAPAAAGGQDSGGQAAGQMLGQLGQLAGQMAQSVTQPIQGMTQGLTQMPQQVMQGVQGIIQTAMQGAGAGGETAAETLEKAKADGADGGKDGEKAPVDAKDGKDSKDAKDAKERDDQAHQGGKQTGAENHRAQVGNRAEAGVAPKPVAERGPTAPTRPM